jgi:hypothetical protein
MSQLTSPTSTPQPQPTKKHHKGLWVLSGVVVAIVIIVVSMNSGGGSAGPNAGPSAGSGSGTTVAAMNTPVRDGKFQFTITSISKTKAVGDTQDGLGATAQGEYVILNLTVTNIGNEAQTLDDSSQYVYDGQGRKYSADGTADIWMANGTSNVWLQSINPGNTMTGQMAFDMPATAVPTKAELHDSMLSGGVTIALH